MGMEPLQVYLPFPKATISQRHGKNANPSYAAAGLLGHTSYDWDVPHGTPVPNCTAKAYCYSILNKDNPDPTKYRAVFFLVRAEDGWWYEISYGHLDKIYAVVGAIYDIGDIIGTAGNTGTVYAGERAVTKAERIRGSVAGTHLHGPQIRPLARIGKRTKRKAIYDAKGLLKVDGFYFEVLDYNNGYNGCVSLAPFSTEKIAVKKLITPGDIKEQLDSLGDVVEVLGELPPETRKQSFIQDALAAFQRFLASLKTKQ